MSVKLRKPAELPIANGAAAAASRPVPLPAMAVSGIVITRQSLVECLRIFVHNISDIEVVDDGERFVLTLGPTPGPVENERQG